MKNFKKLSIGFAIAGLILGTLLVGWFGFDRIGTAILSAGVSGFAIFCAVQLIVMGVLGMAWRAVAPPGAGNSAIFIWGRMVRDSASSCLPFSAVGGFVIGARAIVVLGIQTGIATLSTVVDLTAEFVAEIAFAAAGAVVLLTRSSDKTVIFYVEIGLGAALVLGIAMVWLQRAVTPLFVKLGKRMAGQWFHNSEITGGQTEADLAGLYGHRGRIAVSTAIHLLGWGGKGFGNWIAFWLLGTHIGVIDALAIEGLLHVMLAAAIFIPGYAGVQEAGYIVLGLLFGVPAEISLSVSLLRRARDIAIGVPILLIWQAIEVRGLRKAKT